jgi:hypothetical protein
VKVWHNVGERQEDAIRRGEIDIGRVKGQVGGRRIVDESLRLPVEVGALLSVCLVDEGAVGRCRDVPLDKVAARTFRDLGERIEG